jgi:hypothetical protein
MRRPADIPNTPGVFVLLHADAKYAYVNEARDLKERATMWATHLKAHDRNGTPIRVRNWPRELEAKGDEWEFRYSTDTTGEYAVTVESMAAYLTRAGWKVIRAKQRAQLHIVQGIEASLKAHCERLGIAEWRTVYRRVRSGQTPEEALHLKR